jgi:hypothetical protein
MPLVFPLYLILKNIRNSLNIISSQYKKKERRRIEVLELFFTPEMVDEAHTIMFFAIR